MMCSWNLHQLTSLTVLQKGCKSSWLQILGNQPIDGFPYMRYTNRKYYGVIILQLQILPWNNSSIC